MKNIDVIKSNIILNNNNFDTKIVIGMGTCGIAVGAEKIYSLLNQTLEEKNIKNVRVSKAGCLGICKYEPIVEIYRNGKRTTYVNVKEEMISKIIDEHIIKNNIINEFLIDNNIQSIEELPFYKNQTRLVLKYCGAINPEDINDYVLNDGYKALQNILSENNKEKTIEKIKESTLRGRGGAGFPTGKKWESIKNEESSVKYICCNADEGDPGAFMDRAILEGNPHSVLEAMAIAGFTVGAEKGYIYVRAEYPLAVKRLKIAIKQAKELNLIGNNILGSGFSFDIEIKLGAGAFVCGEETALIASIEGLRGEPKLKPPFPTQKGIFNYPTLINNVETLANIPNILLNGLDQFIKLGTEKSHGTKVFALGGKINNTGLVEVPIGTELKTLIYDIAGGIPNNKEFKAAQMGGPSGGCIPKKYLNIKIDYETLNIIGSMMGSGGLIVMDEDTCMVDISKYFLDFTIDESCGKCNPCRIGTTRIYDILDKISSGKSTVNDIKLLEELSLYVKSSSLCGLGKSAPNPVLSALTHFREEFFEHVINKKCNAKKCIDLTKYTIDKNKCIGCGLCAKNCPVKAISGNIKEPHEIKQDKCIKCGTCINTCKMKAVYRSDAYEQN